MWKAKVRGCRIIDPKVGTTACGVSDNVGRRSAIRNFVTALEQTVGVEESGGLLWLKRKQWIAFHKQWEQASDADAGAYFDKRMKDPAVSKMTLPGDEARLPVADIPRTTAYRKREMRAAVVTTQTIESQAQADDAMAELASVGSGAASLTSPLFGNFAAHLRPGVAAGSVSGQPMMMDAVAPPPTGMVIPESAFEGPVPAKKRPLAERISDPEDPMVPASMKKRRGALSGVTGSLLTLRKRGLAATKDIWETYGKAGRNVAKKDGGQRPGF